MLFCRFAVALVAVTAAAQAVIVAVVLNAAANSSGMDKLVNRHSGARVCVRVWL